MSNSKDQAISVVVAPDSGRRGGATRQSIPVEKLASEVHAFIRDVGAVLSKASEVQSGSLRLKEVDVSASIEVGGKLSLLGTGVESKGQAGISFKFVLPG